MTCPISEAYGVVQDAPTGASHRTTTSNLICDQGSHQHGGH